MRLSRARGAALIAPLATCLPTQALASHFTRLEGNPNLRSESVLVTDAEGNVIYGKDADSVRPIASITKLMTAMVILDSGLDLGEKITVNLNSGD